MLDTLKIQVGCIGKGECKTIDGIRFTNVCILEVLINEKSLNLIEDFDGSLPVLQELVRSSLDSGEYLLFTAASGIADETAWGLVSVDHSYDEILWNYSSDDRSFSFKFDRVSYLSEISEAQSRVASSGLNLEPQQIVFPEV